MQKLFSKKMFEFAVYEKNYGKFEKTSLKELKQERIIWYQNQTFIQ